MLKPKRIKFEKQHRGRMTGRSTLKVCSTLGEYILQANECKWVTARQIEATRRTISHALKREGKLRTLIFPQKPITARVRESRMGAGKGAVSHWVAVIKPNMFLFSIKGSSSNIAIKALLAGSYKLPLKTKIFSTVKIV